MMMNQKLFIYIIFVLNRLWDNKSDDIFDIPVSSFDNLKLLFEDRYPIEEHEVITKDGFILKLHRIPSKFGNSENSTDDQTNYIKKPSIYMHHALGLDSSAWFWSITNNVVLPFTLSDAGYDIWLGNSRGNYLSRKHTKLNYKLSREYWNYTWHEIGIYDLPVIIDYILEKTGTKKLHYIGHSQGTAAFFTLISEMPEYNSKIMSFHGITPVSYMKNTGSIYAKFLSDRYGDPNESYLNVVNQPPPIGLQDLSKLTANFCRIFMKARFCTAIYAHIFGSYGQHINEETAINIFHNSPQGASLKCVIHFFQIIKSGRFRQYDYGEEINLQKYGMSEPPDYNLKMITCPVFLYYSEYDLFTSYVGTVKLSREIRMEALKLNYTVPKKYEFNHMDFIYGKVAKKLIFPKILKGLAQTENENNLK